MNIGNNNPVKLSEYIEAIENSLGIKAIQEKLPLQEGDVPDTYADVSALTNLSGYKPDTTVQQGVHNFVQWFKEYYKIKMMIDQNTKIGVIGLGYVGLPLAVEFGKKFKVVAFDKDRERMKQISQGIDRTGQLEKEEIELSDNLVLTDDPKILEDCSVYIVTVPTPVDQDNKPDFSSLETASEMIGMYIKKETLLYMNRLFIQEQHEKYVFLFLNQALTSNLIKTFFVVILLKE